MQDWKIQGHAHQCQACGASFAEGSAYHTLLYSEESGYERFDICRDCWEGQFKREAKQRKGFISHWRGTYHQPPPPPPEPLQKETAESLLRKLMGRRDARYLAATYILAVMLERKRELRVKAEDEREGQRVFIYEQPKTGDIFTIPDPALRLDQLEEVQHDVTELLEHGLPDEGQDDGAGEAAEESEEITGRKDASTEPEAEGEGAHEAAAEIGLGPDETRE